MPEQLQVGSTIPLFLSEFEGAEFFDSPQAGGGVFAVGRAGPFQSLERKIKLSSSRD